MEGGPDQASTSAPLDGLPSPTAYRENPVVARLYQALEHHHQLLAVMQQSMAQNQEAAASQTAQINALQHSLAAEQNAAAAQRAQMEALQAQAAQAAHAAQSAQAQAAALAQAQAQAAMANAHAAPSVSSGPNPANVVKLPPGVKAPQPYNFHGERDINTLEHWMFTVGEYFSLVGIVDEDQRIQYTGMLLRGAALAWYRSVRRENTVGATWAAFMASLRANFCPINATKRARDRLATMRQTGTLQEFVREFRSVCLEIPGMTDEEKLDRFMRALQTRLRSEVDIQEPKTLDKAVQLAERFDAIFRATGSGGHSFHRHASLSRASGHRGRGPAPMELGYAGRQSGYDRGRQGNRQASGGPSRPDRERLFAEGRCLLCKERGHIARNCPKKAENGQGSRAEPRHRSPSPTGSRA